MYYAYFGLHEAPFSIAVNPRYLFMSPRHRDALAHLLYGVGAGGGFIVLTGEVGTGKTTINRCLLEQLPDNTDTAIILNPALSADELLATACDELGIDYGDDARSLKTLTDKLHQFLLENHAKGRNTVLMIDEAQHLDFDVLEQIRLLTNLETNSEKLLQIILIGQPELAQVLARPELRQLNQRITARYNLGPLSLQETEAYIAHRLEVAGLPPGRELFPAGVIRGIHRKTRGIPRLINVLCDRMLLAAYGQGANQVDKGMLAQAAHEVMGEDSQVGDRGLPHPALLSSAAVLLVAVFIGMALLLWPLADDAEQTSRQKEAAAPKIREAVRVTAAQSNVGSSVPVRSEEDPEAALTPQPHVDATSEGTDWLLPPEEGLALLWSLGRSDPFPAGLCETSSSSNNDRQRCARADAETWDNVLALDRPVVLEAITPQRFAASVVLLYVDASQARVLTASGVIRVPLEALTAAWGGGYRFFWQAPEGFTRPLAMGDRGAVVAEIAALFAQLDGQPQPLTSDRFNAALRQRVRLFQREQGLEDDGVVGERTLMQLNLQLGIDLSSAAALSRLEMPASLVERGENP